MTTSAGTKKYPVRDMGNGKVRAVGMGMAMQGSGITRCGCGQRQPEDQR